MTAVRRPTSAAAVRPRAGGALIGDLWPVAACTILMPIAYVLGLGAVVWLAPAVALLALAVRRRSLHVPTSALPLVAFALWIPITAVAVHGAGSLAVFVYRWLLW